MKVTIQCLTTALCVFGLATIASAGWPRATTQTCTVDGQSYDCDTLCTLPTDCDSAQTHANCDDDNSGKCVICLIGDGDLEIVATAGDDVVCLEDSSATAGDGDNLINAKGGHDIVDAGDGNDVIDGGNGNDEIYAGAGDDIVTGGGGHDVIHAGTGFNQVAGGAGDDDITTEEDAGSPSVLGSILCGDGGKDDIVGTGHGHVCIDGGGANGDECEYVDVTSPDLHDVATFFNCETEVGTAHASPLTGCACP